MKKPFFNILCKKNIFKEQYLCKSKSLSISTNFRNTFMQTKLCIHCFCKMHIRALCKHQTS